MSRVDEVVELAEKGMNAHEIADRLGISVLTVYKYRMLFQRDSAKTSSRRGIPHELWEEWDNVRTGILKGGRR